MQKVQGIGGIFFRSKDPKALAAWYGEKLGVPVESWGGASFVWSEQARSESASTVWSPFKADTEYFAPSEASFMVNFRVEDLDAMLAQLRDAGVQVMDKVERSEFGAFGWCLDPDGNKIELWQPPT